MITAVAMNEAAEKRLDIATRGLDPLIREVVAQAVAEVAKRGFEVLRAETQRTAQALPGIRGGLSWNLGLLACGISAMTVIAAVSVKVDPNDAYAPRRDFMIASAQPIP